MVVAILYTNRNTHKTDQLENVKTATSVPSYHFILTRNTMKVTDMVINTIDFMNHADQCNQFGSPIIFMASFNCFSFSVVINYKFKLINDRFMMLSNDYNMFTLTKLIHGYTKLNNIIIETNCFNPSSNGSYVYGGYG